jgi:deazaflavin-dependent oxidoreductase (nitroreductase family)
MGTDVNDWNRRIIEEFRANGGQVGGVFAGAPMVLLHTTGRKSGKERVNPLVALPKDDRLFVFASYGGADHHPDWFHNLTANREVEVEYGTERFHATAVVIAGPERDELYARQAALRPNFAEYQQKTNRVIPVVELGRRTG